MKRRMVMPSFSGDFFVPQRALVLNGTVDGEVKKEFDGLNPPFFGLRTQTIGKAWVHVFFRMLIVVILFS